MKKTFLFLLFSTSLIFGQITWETINMPDSLVLIQGIQIVSYDTLYITGSPHGFYKTTNRGGTWDYIPIDIPVTIALHRDKYEHIYFGGPDTLIKSTNLGDTWFPIDSFFDDKSYDSFFTFEDSLYVASGDSIYRSSDFGSSWEAIGYQFHFMNNYIKNKDYLYAYNTTISANGFYRSTDDGKTWSWDQYNFYPSGVSIYDNEIYLYSYEKGLFYSNNYGDTFTKLPAFSGEWVYGLTVYKTNEKFFTHILYSDEYSPGVYITEDPFGNWAKVNTISDDILVVFFDEEGGMYIEVPNDKLYYSAYYTPVELESFTASINNSEIQLLWTTSSELNNRGFEIEKKTNNSDWNKIGFIEGKGTTTETNDYTFYDKNNYTGTAFYRLKQIDFDGTAEYSETISIEIIPNEYELKQNYPNPFNPETVIEFTIPQKEWVNLSIYNISGEIVETLINNTVDGGTHQIVFNAKDLSSGIYVCRLKTSGKTFTIKTLFLK